MFKETDANNSSFINVKFKDIIFDACNLEEVEFLNTNLNNIDFSNSEIDGIVVNMALVKGCLVNTYQAVELSKLLGLKIK
jgi:uncharacterized protein YjbI with pentapeptide repeats